MGNIDRKVLNSIYQSSKIGLDSVEYIYGKVNDRKLKSEINNYAKKYYNILTQMKEKTENKYDVFIDYRPVTNELMWKGIQDMHIYDNTKDIANLLIEGSKKSISNIIQYSNNEMVHDDIKKIADNLITFEKQNIENMKKYVE